MGKTQEKLISTPGHIKPVVSETPPILAPSPAPDTNPFPLITNVPTPGQIVYLPDSKIPGRGLDDRNGGWAQVIAVRKSLAPDNSPRNYFNVQEFPDAHILWEGDLASSQSTLRSHYEMMHAHVKPDCSVENNYLTEPYRMP